MNDVPSMYIRSWGAGSPCARGTGLRGGAEWQVGHDGDHRHGLDHGGTCGHTFVEASRKFSERRRREALRCDLRADELSGIQGERLKIAETV